MEDDYFGIAGPIAVLLIALAVAFVAVAFGIRVLKGDVLEHAKPQAEQPHG